MKTISRLEQATDNAAEFWLAQARAHGWQRLVDPRFTAVRCARTPEDAHRIVVTRPGGDIAALEDDVAGLIREWGSIAVTVEDPYGILDMTRHGLGHGLAMAVMTREPGPLENPRFGEQAAVPGPDDRSSDRSGAGAGAAGSGASSGGGWSLTVDEVLDADGFAEVEHAVVDGFPIEARRPWTRGGMLPEALLEEPGLRAWLGRVDGAPAGACLTYDDGRATGVYWVATLPDHRSRGVGRAVLETALAGAHPDRPATLVATMLGEPLYRKLGFTEQGRTHWWTPLAPVAE
ncbi:GNAT family N-acetyltransferase [Kitasatospora sp. A2-31]|uniref:GNAT family N-acetyltransferase n=1 Tax=Kitasatospora sp. A2-31 TaxID=2916414 RepID=UPI001EEC1DB8|nr:GNAT family N-acetyltransferase [Kitasatospora sp. A2-31]MCG6496209.1 GNAT family N-acetyltransferase [Kitasatospora sp. A2-31]